MLNISIGDCFPQMRSSLRFSTTGRRSVAADVVAPLLGHACMKYVNYTDAGMVDLCSSFKEDTVLKPHVVLLYTGHRSAQGQHHEGDHRFGAA